MGWWFVGLGGCVGALLRHGCNQAARALGIPAAATLAVNVLGCFALGWVSGALLRRPDLSESLRSFLVIGLLGAFTTYSTFAGETFEWLRAGEAGRALGWMGLHLTLGLAAVWLGFRAAA